MSCEVGVVASKSRSVGLSPLAGSMAHASGAHVTKRR